MGVSPQRGRQASWQILGSLGQAGSMQWVCMSMHGTSMQPRRRAVLSRLPLCTVSNKSLRMFCTQRYGTEVGRIAQLKIVCKAQHGHLRYPIHALTLLLLIL